MKTIVFSIASVVCLSLFNIASADFVGDIVTVQYDDQAVTGVVGTDDLSVVVSSRQNTIFDPVFQGNSIDIGFSTEFPTGAWAFADQLIFSGLDMSGSSTITNAFLTAASLGNANDLMASDLTFTDTSFTLDLDGIQLRNGQEVTVTLETTSSIPEPSTCAPIALASLATLLKRRRKKWRNTSAI